MCETIVKFAKARSAKLAKDAAGETSPSSSAQVDPGQYSMGGQPPDSSASVQEQATGSMGYRGSIGQDSAIGKFARARRPKIAQDGMKAIDKNSFRNLGEIRAINHKTGHVLLGGPKRTQSVHTSWLTTPDSAKGRMSQFDRELGWSDHSAREVKGGWKIGDTPYKGKTRLGTIVAVNPKTNLVRVKGVQGPNVEGKPEGKETVQEWHVNHFQPKKTE